MIDRIHSVAEGVQPVAERTRLVVAWTHSVPDMVRSIVDRIHSAAEGIQSSAERTQLVIERVPSVTE